MSNQLFVQLEVKIDDMIETLEILRLQVSDLEEKNQILHTENTTLKGRQSEYEQGLTSLMRKLDHVSSTTQGSNRVEAFETEIEDATV